MATTKIENSAAQLSAAANIKNIWGSIIYNVKSAPYNAKGDGANDDSAAVQRAITAAAANGGGTIHFPPGTYNASFTIDSNNITLELDGAATINGTVTVDGDGVIKSNAVQLTGAWATFPVGTTTFAGNFSAYATGNIVVIETTVLDGLFNQAGIDFGTVVTASSTQLVIALGTKYPYYNPKISKATNIKYITGTLAEDDFTIPGDHTAILSVGDIIRIENRNGTDGVDASSAYFELDRVKSIDASGITLENRLVHSFTDYWIMKYSTVKGFYATGGKINILNVRHAQNFKIENVTSQEQHHQYIYDFAISGIKIENPAQPIGLEVTYAWNGTMSDIRAKGSEGWTDNGNVKLMSVSNSIIENVISVDTKSTNEGVYPFFVDYYFTPYRCWNDNLTIKNINVTGNKGVTLVDTFLIGMRRCNISGLSMYNNLWFRNSQDCVLSGVLSESPLTLDRVTRCVISDFNASMLDITTLIGSRISNGNISGLNAVNNMTVWMRAGSSNVDLVGLKIPDNNNENIFIENSDNILIDGCSDGSGTGNSVNIFGTGNTNIRLGANNFSKTVNDSVYLATSKYYGVPKGVNAPVFSFGRNAVTGKNNVTGDGTEYICAFDGDASAFNKNAYGDPLTARFICPTHLAGKYRFTAQVALYGVGAAHTLGELYLKQAGIAIQLDYQNYAFASDKSILLKGSVLLDVVAGETVQLFVKVTGGSKTVSFHTNDLKSLFSGEMIFAE